MIAGSAVSHREPVWRRLLAVGVLGVGILNLVSAIFPAERARLSDLRGLVPLSATHVATSATALAGVALIVLARQLWHGKHRAMVVAASLLAASAFLHILKGLDFEEGSVAAVLAILLVLRRKEFSTESDPASLTRLFRVAPLLFGGGITFGVTALWVNRGSIRPGFGLGAAIKETVLRMVALSGPLKLGGRFEFENWFPIAMATIGIGSLAFCGFLLFRPVIKRLHRADDDVHDARLLVHAHDEDSLSYFALRSDKDYFFNESRTAFLAYRYLAGLAFVSGDPIGPRGDWPALLADFLAFCRRHGWRVAVVGAARSSLPIYQTLGFRSYHMGDEALVDPQTFALEGRKFRNVRQSANHVKREGYTFRLLEVKELDAETRKELLAISARWRGVTTERGFTMALGRLLSPEDPGVLVAIAHDATGKPRGFLQFVPFREGRGYSMDAMRRDRNAPSGLNEYLIVESISRMKERGADALTLNFVTFAAQISKPHGFHAFLRVQRRVFLGLSRYFQIESLLRFNRKFNPEWLPRYIVYEEFLGLPRVGLAVLQAEAFFRLPVVGRYF